MKLSNKIFKHSVFAIIFISAVLIGSCSEDSTVNPPENPGGGTTNTTVAGIVVNENREPVAGATVSVHGNTTVTGSGGEFMFNNIAVPSGRLFVNVTATGYFNASRGELPKSGSFTQLKITMIPKTVTHTINSATGGSADLSNGSKVEIGQNSVVLQNGGSQYNGTINMSVVYMDPTSNTFSETVQGGDMAARRSDSSSATLYSYGILKVVMEGSAGEPLQLSSGSTSQITTTIPGTMVSSAPATIPIWFFDESTGLWREEGTATKQGDKYIGTVSHFTDWNCDIPGTTAKIQGKVINCVSQPVPGITLKVGQGTTITDANGNYERNVPAGITFNVSIEASQNFGLSCSPVLVGPLGAGTTQTLGDLSVDCAPMIRGIYKDCNNNPVYGMVSAKWDNQIQISVRSDGNGFGLTVAPNKTAIIRFISVTGTIKDTTIQTPSSATTLDLGSMSICGGGGGQCENSFVLNGGGFNNLFVNITGGAAIGIYFIGKSETAISAVAPNGDHVALFFPGNTTGNFSGQNGNIQYQGVIMSASGTASGTVTIYEGVGGIIKGTFQGSFETLQQETIQVSNGKFCVIRQPDQN